MSSHTNVINLSDRKSDRHKNRGVDSRTLAVFDMETEPFDNVLRTRVWPFMAVLYIDETNHHTFINENANDLIREFLAYISEIKTPLLIYAHNGGRFDYKLMVHFIRGEVLMKPGRIMQFDHGIHQFRDSLCLIPAPLAAIQKDAFDYSLLKQSRRAAFMDVIEKYCIDDCRYLLNAIKLATGRWGRKLTIGSVAKAQITELYPNITGMTEEMDTRLRPFFSGGRVDCIAGIGIFRGNFECWDFNSSYPFSMSHFRHPIGRSWFQWKTRKSGGLNPNTAFIELSCISHGAFSTKDENGILTVPRDDEIRRYRVTIHELRAALEYDLLSCVTYHSFQDCSDWSTFERYIAAQYEARRSAKELMNSVPQGSPAYIEAKIEDLLVKLLLNNSYGKFAQDPRRQYEYLYLADSDPAPSSEWKLDTIFTETHGIDLPENLVIYKRPPSKLRFNNVAIAASITGASRSILVEALQFARNPIYCDTDSIICEGFYDQIFVTGHAVDNPLNFSSTELGGLKLEWSASEVAIAGKKLYSNNNNLVKAKGMNAELLDHEIMKRVVAGEEFENVSRAPNLGLNGVQNYIVRMLRATGSRGDGSKNTHGSPKRIRGSGHSLDVASIGIKAKGRASKCPAANTNLKGKGGPATPPTSGSDPSAA